ncbi:seminal ribonuclease-like [Pongo pygmaeus]|uniref:seminal ribonuclease-like n=1 Tax=Pongo pygmaeus TaxID=9600 RepID=UPI003006FA9E
MSSGLQKTLSWNSQKHESDVDPPPLPPFGSNCLHSSPLVPRGHHRYCDVMMRCCWLIYRGKCKPIHAFIHENLTTIADFCGTPPLPCTNSPSMCSCHNSTHDVNITDCFASTGTRPLRCHYQK